MTSTMPSQPAGEQLQNANTNGGGLDVDWLIHKKDPSTSLKRSASTTSRNNGEPKEQSKKPSPPPSTREDNARDPVGTYRDTPQTNGASKPPLPSIKEPKSTAVAQAQPVQAPTPTPKPLVTPQKQPPPEDKHRLSLKKEGRRSSWLSSLGSKLSGSAEKSSRSNSISSVTSNKAKSPQPSPAGERSNPFDSQSLNTAAFNADEQKPVHVGPRRPSVLVAAGTETKLEQPSFLSSALRRLSSSNTAQLGKGATTGAICPRKVMNIDPNRQRTRIPDFDQNKLRRVAFKVDVEIAGIAAQADEQPPVAPQDAASAAAAGFRQEPPLSKDAKMAKYKDRSEGAALKKTSSREVSEKPESAPPSEAKALAKEEEKKQQVEQAVKITVEDEDGQEGGQAADDKDKIDGEPSSTRKKEKKKRSEAERKERKEKKRRQAEANGLVPLEITIDKDLESDSSGTPLPSGATTPQRKGQPTTDPLRIYKRCCQLRESPALACVKEQISKPQATLAETPGTVGVVDLTGAELSLADVQTLGDWLAVVPVRKLVLDDCNLSDEAVRIILAGLSGCKNADQARANRKLPKKGTGKHGFEQMSVIKRLSLKNNTAISAIGWKHIALFLHLCHSLRAIDLSGIPFPANASADLSRTSTTSSSIANSQELPPRRIDLSTLFARALAERFGDNLEELIMSRCELTTQTVSELIDSTIKCKIKRLGLADNHLDLDAVSHVVKYVVSGCCEGLDMGGNDLNGSGHLLTQVLDEKNPLFAMSLADCNLSVEDLRAILQHLSTLQNFKFIDLSRNRGLFENSDNIVPLLRKRLPQMKDLKRIHLADMDMTPSQLISLAEIFPDCPVLAHVSVLGNQKLIECINSTQADDQEEACAIFVALMTAVRASKTLVAVEIEVPSQESSEVVKALSSQVVAYSLRNLERSTLPEMGVQQDGSNPDKHNRAAPEVLLHVVGHMEGYAENHDNDEPAPDEDYMMATNGIVRALGVCLGNKEASGMHSRNISPAASGTATPRSGIKQGTKKPKDVSLELCESARKIRTRLAPAMVKEDRAGNTEGYRRLLYLDQTLQRIIKRFEDEYPESRPRQSPSMLSIDSGHSAEAQPSESLARLTSLDDERPDTTAAEPEPYSLKLSRTASNTSLAARALTEEEGRMHRFGQHFRREVLKPSQQDDVLHGTSVDDAPEPAALAALRVRLEALNGDEIKSQIETQGADNVIRELGINLKQLRMLEQEDPEGFAILKESQLAALFNSGLLSEAEYEKRRGDATPTTGYTGATAIDH